jgi:hypothetical protein
MDAFAFEEPFSISDEDRQGIDALDRGKGLTVAKI